MLCKVLKFARANLNLNLANQIAVNLKARPKSSSNLKMTVIQSKQRQKLNNQKNGSKSMQTECTFHFYGFNIQLRITSVKVENFEIDKVLVSCRGSMHAKEHIKASTLRFYIKVYHTKKACID